MPHLHTHCSLVHCHLSSFPGILILHPHLLHSQVQPRLHGIQDTSLSIPKAHLPNLFSASHVLLSQWAWCSSRDLCLSSPLPGGMGGGAPGLGMNAESIPPQPGHSLPRCWIIQHKPTYLLLPPWHSGCVFQHCALGSHWRHLQFIDWINE